MNKKLAIFLGTLMVAFFLFSANQVFSGEWAYWNATGTGNPVWTHSPNCPIMYTAGPTGTKQGHFEIDMTDFDDLYMSVEIVNPAGWVLNIGDSPTNNGWAGDAGTFYNDAEFQILGYDATLYSNQYSFLKSSCNIYATPSCSPYGGMPFWPYPATRVRKAIISQGTSAMKIHVADQSFSMDCIPTGKNVEIHSPYIFRLGGDDDEHPTGHNDKKWWVGANRVVSGHSGRTGTGAETISFSLQP